MAALTPEVTDLNFIRIISLFSEIGKDCLLKAFYSFVQKGNVQSYFQSDKIQNRIDDLLKSGILVGDQYDKLKDENIKPHEFDLAMLFVLLRYVIEEVPAPVKGWNILPSVGDNSLGACLLKVQRIRNEVVHNLNVKLGIEELEEKWDDLAHYLRVIIESVCGREDSKKVSKRIRELKNTSKEDLSRNLTQNVDQVFLWSASDFSRLQSKLAEGQIRSNSETQQSQKDGLDEPDAKRIDPVGLQSEVENIAKEFQAISVDELSTQTNNLPSTSTDSSHVVQKLNDMTRKVNDIYTWVQEMMLRLHAQAPQPVPMSRQCEGDFQGNREFKRPRPLNRNAMTDKDIKTFSQKIGRDFHQLALFLNFEQTQFDMLVRSFQGMSEQTFRLVKAWHDVVVDCDENPKELLASTLYEIGNRYLAVEYFGEQFANESQGKEPKPETAKRIQEINFGAEAQRNAAQNVHIYNIGASNSLNMFDGEMTIGGAITIGSDFRDNSLPGFGSHSVGTTSSLPSLSSVQGSSGTIVTNMAQPYSINVMGGKLNTAPGSYISIRNNFHCWDLNEKKDPAQDFTDGAFCSSLNAGNFKRKIDESLTQTMMESYTAHMKCVGALVAYGNIQGTVFRVGKQSLMTAWHVVNNIIDPDKKGVEDFSNLSLENTYVSFTDSPLEQGIRYQLESYGYRDTEHDLAVLQIRNPDDHLPPPMLLRKEGIDPLFLNFISIIGFGHPEQNRTNKKNFEYKCQLVTPNSNEMRSALVWLKNYEHIFKKDLYVQGKDPKYVELGYGNYDADFKILFHCFMEHGSSGSPIIRICPSALNTAASVEVVGVVTHGIPAFFFDLSTNGRILVPHNKRFEAGSRMEHIFKQLHSTNYTLAAELFNLPDVRESDFHPINRSRETAV
ncbi:uncharacterized protein LOC128244622 [Mya arenaria]|uniref:uncharacterized protein LOC128244622 n=1 Tax=Mya arenaria TaxID=6604 RepID=UPI0022E5C12A|nr:uncharacterized protein LOC128244622 [Mya arenaria]